MSVSILHEDTQWIAVAKPSGQLVIPGRGIPGPTLQQQAEEYLGSKAYVVHRLDREASGLVLFAKNAIAHRVLCRAFETRQIHKLYAALVQGHVEKDGTIDRPIRAFGSGRMGVDEGGRPSITRYRRIEQFADTAFLEVEPESGRRHQIRVHLYSIGHPIEGDPLYGKERALSQASRLMLHALGLQFEFEDRSFNIRCEIPADFSDVLKSVRSNPSI